MKRKSQQIVIFLFFCSAFASAQTAHIKGRIAGLKASTLIFSYPQGDSSHIDTVSVRNGKFHWQAAMPEPRKVYIFFPERLVEFFAEAGRIKIQGKADALDQLVFSGSKTQQEAEAFEASLKDLSDLEMPLYQKYGKLNKKEQVALEAKLEDIRKQRRERANQYIAAHPQSPVSVSLVSDRAAMGDYADVKTIFELLDPAARQTVVGRQVEKRLDILKRSNIGEPMLNFTQNNTDGVPVRFADYKGKYVFVDFWASWCHPCRAENPNVLRAYNRYKDKNFTVIGVSLDDNGDKWKKAIKDDNMPWTQLSDLKGWRNELSTYYGIQGIPSSLLVDPQGRIIAKNLRGEALNRKLAELFD
jgi:peroxiredoxin